MKSPQATRAVTLRPVGPGDEPFLYRVYASTREDEVALTGWDREQQEAFLRQQFGAQQAHYRQHYQDAALQVVLCDGVPVGRLYVSRWADEIRIVDIALLPHWRNAGIGTALLRGLLEEGTGTGKRVSIHVERFNPALRLYARLGFRLVQDKGVYLLLEWTPEASGLPGSPEGEPRVDR
ncbi:MAG TPA: GNAT family N-acetyltransferase [Chloroflexota bacterium]|nr:GNAT family N-acetyltransferase [Chloroflexota bacterium]